MNAKEILTWYSNMGIEDTISDQAENNFNKVEQIMPAKPKQTQSIKDPDLAKSNTHELASNCKSLAELEACVKNFKDLSICKTATNTVFCDGVSTADIMFIGEAPGADEDKQGIPFCGMSGKLLDHMLAYIGLKRDSNFYITNTIFWRPPGNRRPTPEEINICRPFLEKHIALINPKLIILVGGTAVTSVLNNGQIISKVRGTFNNYENPFLAKPIPVTAVFHPSYLLRSPGQKKLMWQDLLKIEDYIKANDITVN